MMALLSALATEIAIPVCAFIGIAFSLVLWLLGSRNSDNLYNKERTWTPMRPAEDEHDKIADGVRKGVKKFQSRGYWYVLVFVVAFVSLIFPILGSLESFNTQSSPCKSDSSNKCKPALATAFFTAVSFLLGAFISVLSGFLGMEIGIRANKRTALEEKSLDGGNSIAALSYGAVMGFVPAGIGLLGLYIEINLFMLYYGNDWEGLFKAIAGYGLGGSSMAFLGRACGGIYAKAADVCFHLFIENDSRIPQTDRYAAVIPNYVGDIVGDIAGVALDFFGSYAESSCAALVVASVSPFGIEHDFTAMCYPLLISSMGILVGTFVCFISIHKKKISILKKEIELASKKAQLITSTILMTAGIAVVSLIALPPFLTVNKIESPEVVPQKVANCFLPNFDASNVSVGLGSVSIPLFAAISISVSSHFAATYGIAVAALGMLSTISTRLAMDAYARISGNAKRIAQMTRVGTLDAVDNHKADIAEGFAIESTALVSIALLGAFVNHPAILSPANVLTPKVIIGLIMGAWLPSYFSSMTIKRVGRAGFKMAREIWKHIGVDGSPDCDKCFEIATNASFNAMIGPGALVMSAPLIVGTVFGVETLSGLLAGSLGSVVQSAISASRAGGARNQLEEDIWASALEYARTLDLAHGEQWLLRSAEKGRTTGHPRKDTSGPTLNILVQLMAVESLVLAPWFASHGGLLSKFI